MLTHPAVSSGEKQRPCNLEGQMKVYVLTNIGSVRKDNQDAAAFEVFEKKNRAVMGVCDGMGGARAGSVASNMAVDCFIEQVKPVLNAPKRIPDIKKILISAAEKANEAVFDKSVLEADCRGMGTTLVALFMDGSKYFIVNIGDSRGYHISGGKAVRITRDHSLVEEMVDRGTLTQEQARTHPQKNVITRAIGIASEVKSDVFEGAIKKGEFILLCSDGLTNIISDEEILRFFEKDAEPETICAGLMDLALERGAPDNVTTAVLSA